MVDKKDIVFGGLLTLAACVWSFVALVDVATGMKPVESSTYFVSSEESTASAVAIGSRILLTAGHVAEHGLDATGGKESFEFDVSNDYTKEPTKAKAIFANKAYDIGILLADRDLPHKSEIDCRNTRIGESVTVVGYPATITTKIDGSVLTTGVISSRIQKGNDEWREWVLIDALAGRGNSGGPVFDAKRSVVGILTTIFGKKLEMDDEEMLWVPSGYSGMVPSSTICRLFGLK